jgi:hypothetical protein
MAACAETISTQISAVPIGTIIPSCYPERIERADPVPHLTAVTRSAAGTL